MNTMAFNILTIIKIQKEGGGLANADRADKGRRGGGGGEVLTMADKGGRRGVDPPILGLYRLRTAHN